MKKLIGLVFIFLAIAICIVLPERSTLPVSLKIALLVLVGIVFQIATMDRTFFKKQKRAELRKVIDDYVQ